MTAVVPPISLDDQQHMVLQGVSWGAYDKLLREVGDRAVRMTFDDGTLEIMSPLPEHEAWKSRLARMIDMLAFELGILVEPYGSTTLRRRPRKGLEPDACYFVQHADSMRDPKAYKPAAGPPPDLAIEIDITSRSVPRQPIYAALGVPELWRFDGSHLSVLVLTPERSYEPAEASVAFPFLPMRQFEAFLLRLASEANLVVLREFRDWVRTLPLE